MESTTVSEHPSECTTVSLSKHVVVTTTSVCTNHVSNPKMAASSDQNKINTKVEPAISSCILSINKVHSSKDTQSQDSTSMYLHLIYIYNVFNFIIYIRFLSIVIIKISFVIVGTQKTQSDNINSMLSDNISSNPSTTKSSKTLCDPIIQNYTRMTSKMISYRHLFVVDKNA